MSSPSRWEPGSGVPASRYGKTVLVRMRRHHDYEKADREDRIASRLERIVAVIASDFRRGKC